MKMSSAHSDKGGLQGYIRNPETGEMIHFKFPSGVRKLPFEVFVGDVSHEVELVVNDREGLSKDDPFDREIELIAPPRPGVKPQNRAGVAPPPAAPVNVSVDGHELKGDAPIADGPVVIQRELVDPEGKFGIDKDAPSSAFPTSSTTPHLVERGLLERVVKDEEKTEEPVKAEEPKDTFVTVSHDEPMAPRAPGFVSVADDEPRVEFPEGMTELVSVEDGETAPPNTELVSVAEDEPKVKFPGDTPSGAPEIETPTAPTPPQGSTPSKKRERR